MKALALVDAPDHVCCRYRVRAFQPALVRAGWSLDSVGFARGLLGRVAQLARLAHHETILIQRKLLPAWQLRAIRRKAGRLVFDFDDAVLYRDSYDPRGPVSARRARRFAATVRLADAVIAGNAFLANCAIAAGAPANRVHVVPTCVDTARYPTADVPVSHAMDLVWIGSSSTLQGLEARRSLWDAIARAVPGVRLRVICDRFPRFETMPVVAVAWSEASEAQALAAGGVGISWIPDDLWSRGKCGLKVLQYQASGLPVLTNPVGVHPEMVETGVNGWLAATSDEWIDAVRTLAADPELRRRMGRAARASVEARYAVAAWEKTFVEIVAGAPGGRATEPRTSSRASRQCPIGAKG